MMLATIKIQKHNSVSENPIYRSWIAIALGLMFSLICLPIFADQEMTFKASVDRNEITIGDPIQLKLELSYPVADGLIAAPEMEKVEPFEILDHTQAEPTVDNGIVTLIDYYKISIYETGEFEIPELNLEFELKDGSTREVTAPPIPITVVSVLSETDQASPMIGVRDIKEPLVLHSKLWPRLWPWLAILGGILLGLIIGLIIYLKHRKTVLNRPEPELPPRPAHEVAFEQLTDLRQDKKGYLANREYILFSVEVSDILREYLHGRFSIPAEDRTTEEIITETGRLNLSEAIQNQMREFFEDCDLVKFAQSTLNRDDMKHLIDLSWEIVEKTWQTPSFTQTPVDQVSSPEKETASESA